METFELVKVAAVVDKSTEQAEMEVDEDRC